MLVDPADRGIASHHFKKTPFLLGIKLRRMNDLELGATVAGEDSASASTASNVGEKGGSNCHTAISPHHRKLARFIQRQWKSTFR